MPALAAATLPAKRLLSAIWSLRRSTSDSVMPKSRPNFTCCTSGEKVVTMGTPFSTILSMVSGVMDPPCSTQSTPASTTREMASSKVAWAVTIMPFWCASSTMARSSSIVNCTSSWEPMILIQVAPALNCSRMALRTP